MIVPTVIPALSDDAEALTALAFAAKKHWGYPDTWMEKWTDALTIRPAYIEAHHVMKLVISEEIIGCCAVEKIAEGYEVTHLWIHPTQIGKGYGRLLLHHTLNAIIDLAATVQVESDPNAKTFYERQGFRQVGQVESWPPGRYLPLLSNVWTGE